MTGLRISRRVTIKLQRMKSLPTALEAIAKMLLLTDCDVSEMIKNKTRVTSKW